MQTVKDLEETMGLTDTNRSFIALDITEEKKVKIVAHEENVKNISDMLVGHILLQMSIKNTYRFLKQYLRILDIKLIE